MKLLLSGWKGTVGAEFIRQAKLHSFISEVVCPELDVIDGKKTFEVVQRVGPDAIFHLAAKTDVDGCERNVQECYNVNVDGTKNICAAAKAVGAWILYPSTTYIYDGDKGSPYDERVDQIIPNKIVGVYSKSKWEGELLIRELPQHVIVRFGALFGGGSKDKKFVAKIIQKVRSGVKEISAVQDRVIQPSSVKESVNNLLKLIEIQGRGVFNMVSLGCATYVEYAQAVVDFIGAKDVKVVGVPSLQFLEAAPRAKNITAVNGRLDEMGINLMRDWRVSLKEYIDDSFK